MPRVEQLIDIQDKTCPCRAGTLHRIGEDVAERLDVIPATFQTLAVRRPKYGCWTCEQVVVQAPTPSRLIEGACRPRRRSPTSSWASTLITAVVPPGAGLRPPRRGAGSLHPGALDWLGRRAPEADAHAAAERLKASGKLFADETAGAGAHPRGRPHPNRPAVGVSPRRPNPGRP